jgi:hypothetical protein
MPTRRPPTCGRRRGLARREEPRAPRSSILRLRPLDDALFLRLVAELEAPGHAADRADLWEARADALEDADAPASEVAEALRAAAQAHTQAGAHAAASHALERVLERARAR